MTAPNLDRPPISVVIASLVGPPFIDNCLASLEEQARQAGAEVIVVACGGEDYAPRIARRFPWVRVIHRRSRETVPELRRIGVREARAEIVAIIEEHCVAGSGWLAQAMLLRQNGDAAAGGPVCDNGYARLADWAVYFCEYNGSLPPWPEGETRELNGANIVYKRDLLLQHEALLGQGYWEATLHPALLAAGGRFRSLPRMTVHHCGPFRFGYYLRQRYWFSRAFAGSRAGTQPLSRRLAYLIAAPAVPLLLLGRMASRIWSKRQGPGDVRPAKFLLALPLLLIALSVYALGEWAGYLAGPGGALSKVE